MAWKVPVVSRFPVSAVSNREHISNLSNREHISNYNGVMNRVDPDSVGSLTIINCNTKTKIYLPKIMPLTLEDTYEASFTEQSIIGRSTPLLVYTGGSSKKLTFSLDIHEDMLPDGDLPAFVDKVRALSYPVYDGGIKPPRVYCKIANQYSFWGTCNVSVTYKVPVRRGHFIMAALSFTFFMVGGIPSDEGIYEADPLSAFDVESGKGSNME